MPDSILQTGRQEAVFCNITTPFTGPERLTWNSKPTPDEGSGATDCYVGFVVPALEWGKKLPPSLLTAWIYDRAPFDSAPFCPRIF